MFFNNPVLAEPAGQTFEEFEALAKTCAHQARLLLRMAGDAQDAAVEMWEMAARHQRTAAELNGGTLPDLGEKPFK